MGNLNQSVPYSSLTTAQIAALTGTVKGEKRENSDTGLIVEYNGSVWKDVVYAQSVASNTVTVSSSGGDYTSLKAAVDYVKTQTPSTTNRWVINVAPGVYTEAPMGIVPFMAITSSGRFTTKIVASDINNPLFTFSGAGAISIENLTIAGVTGHSAFYLNSASTAVSLKDLQIRDCDYGVQVDVGGVFADNIGTTPSSVFTNMFLLSGGSIQITNCNVNSNTTFDNYIEAESASLGINNLFLNSVNIGTGIIIIDSNLTVNNSYFAGMTKAIELDGDSHVDTSSVTIQDNVTTHIDIVDTQVELHCIGGKLNSDKILFPTGYDNNIITFMDTKPNDEGFKIYGELGVGHPIQPKESVFGGGDSYTNGMLVYTFDGTTYSDVTDEMSDPVNDTVAFPNNNVNTAIYFASKLEDSVDKLQHLGLKMNIDSIGAESGYDYFTFEYWDGSAWTDFTYMMTHSGGSYTSHARNIFDTAGSWQIRHDIRLSGGGVFQFNWAKNDAPGFGTDLYWVRLRIKQAITSSPLIKQVKLHTNRTKINTDGYIEHFGLGRPIGRFSWDLGMLEASNNSPANQDLFISDTLNRGHQENKFIAGAKDRIGFNSMLPYELDTSCPVILRWAYKTDDVSAGNIRWVVRTGWSKEGDDIHSSTATTPSTGANEITYLHTIAAPITANIMHWEAIALEVADMVSSRDAGFGDQFWITLERTGNDVSDTHTGDVSVIAFSGNFIRWNNGGHVE